jgi:hypothetical protein
MASTAAGTFAKRLFTLYDGFRGDAFPTRHFAPELLQRVLRKLTADSGGVITMQQAGKSFEGRPINLLTIGKGKTKVFLWSQMHGDESTATMALCDILHYFILHPRDADVRKILSTLTIQMLPMLNPDGASRTMRRTAQGIDMNRDAEALCTPEAQLLKKLQRKLRPQFGFNLHDQELSTVGTTKDITAVAVLAPAYDAAKSSNAVRTLAKHLTAHLVATLQNFVPDAIGRYDDSFEPRAFGDNMQKWGTSTILIESGHALNDPQKDFIRKLNAVGLLSCFNAIASGEYLKANIARYESLPFNGKKAYDVIIRDVIIDHGKGRSTRADLGISYQVDTHSENPPRLADIGDLRTFIGMREIEGRRKRISTKKLKLGLPFEWERIF